MGEGSSNARELSLGDDFGDVVVKANGAQVKIGADGSIHGLPAPANNSAAKGKTAPEIGDEMADGTVYAGISPDTHKPMYARPRDESVVLTFNEAAKHAKNLEAHGHHDFRAPSKNELSVLRENRNKGKLAGTFNETGSTSAGWYWSSTPNYKTTAWAQRFSDGIQSNIGRDYDSSLRCVR
jgi:hypothetical protein